MAILDQIERFAPFDQLSADGKALLEQGLVHRKMPRASAVLHKGEPISGAYVVLSGRLRVFALAPGGYEATLYFVNPGDTCVLSVNCLFNDLLYPAWVQAETATTLAVIPGPVYRKLFEREPGIRNLTVAALSTLVYRLMAELEDVHTNTHREWLAQFVLRHASTDGTLRMTQQQLAHHLGTTREVVARLMQAFVAQGLLTTQRGMITIRDLFGLRRIIQG